jgi:hypothetical protein
VLLADGGDCLSDLQCCTGSRSCSAGRFHADGGAGAHADGLLVVDVVGTLLEAHSPKLQSVPDAACHWVSWCRANNGPNFTSDHLATMRAARDELGRMPGKAQHC